MVRHLKRLKSSRLGCVQAFPMYGGLGMSAPSLHMIISVKTAVQEGVIRCRITVWERLT